MRTQPLAFGRGVDRRNNLFGLLLCGLPCGDCSSFSAKTNSKAVTVEAGKTVAVPNDGFGPVVTEQFDLIKKAFSEQ